MQVLHVWTGIVAGMMLVFSGVACHYASVYKAQRAAYGLLAIYGMCLGAGLCFFMMDASLVAAVSFWSVAMFCLFISIWQFMRTLRK